MITMDRLSGVCAVNSYLAPQISPDGDRWFCLAQMMFTVGILHGTERGLEIGPAGRFCYHDYTAAIFALAEWKERGFKGKPLNYITEK